MGGVRRTRLVATDAATTTWEGWDTWAGRRVLVRFARPGRRDDPEVRAALAAPATSPLPVRVLDDWPRRVVGPVDGTLADLLPVTAPVDPAWAAGVLGAAMVGIRDAAAAGRVHGGPLADLLVTTPAGWVLADLGPPVPSPPPEADLRALGELAAALGAPYPVDAVADFAVHPPAHPADAARVLVRALGEALGAERHRLVARRRRQGTLDRVTRLLLLVDRLGRAGPPPRVTGCLRAGRDGVLVLVDAAPDRVRGGPAAAPDPKWLPTAWTPERADTPALRALLRAWNTRRGGDEVRRAEVNRALGVDDEALDRLVRWLAAAGRLRADRLLLGARRR